MAHATLDDVRQAVKDIAEEIISDCSPETDRETLIERIDEECDSAWGNLVKTGRIDQYDATDLAQTAPSCSAIIQVAEQDAWVEDDHGLWEGLTYGVLASIAYFSLRNLIYQALVDAGVDSNDDMPFRVDLSSMSGWDVAKHFGCDYTGDANPIDHDGTFYDARDWEQYGYASCVQFTRIADDDDALLIECGTIHKPEDMQPCYECCGVGDDVEKTTHVQIECALAYYGAEPTEDMSGRLSQRFADGTDEDEIWNAVTGWLQFLGTKG